MSDYRKNHLEAAENMPDDVFRSQKATDFHPLILVVEADEDTRLMMKYLLQIWKFRVVETFGNEEREVLESADRHQPDLVLISGRSRTNQDLATVRRLREKADFDKTVIIFISGFNESAVCADALAAGADDFLSKPINFGQLETMLKQFGKKKFKGDGLFLQEVQ